MTFELYNASFLDGIPFETLLWPNVVLNGNFCDPFSNPTSLGIITLFGLFGNSLIIYVTVKRGSSLRSNANIFIAVLAFADLLSNVGAVQVRLLRIMRKPFFCLFRELWAEQSECTECGNRTATCTCPCLCLVSLLVALWCLLWDSIACLPSTNLCGE